MKRGCYPARRPCPRVLPGLFALAASATAQLPSVRIGTCTKCRPFRLTPRIRIGKLDLKSLPRLVADKVSSERERRGISAHPVPDRYMHNLKPPQLRVVAAPLACEPTSKLRTFSHPYENVFLLNSPGVGCEVSQSSGRGESAHEPLHFWLSQPEGAHLKTRHSTSSSLTNSVRLDIRRRAKSPTRHQRVLAALYR